jgi:hypothetical protein
MDHRIEIFRKNGAQHAWCTVCHGNGGIECSDGTGDPERDFTEKCDVCDGRGFWRVTPLDTLEVLQLKRRFARSVYGAMEYGEALQKAVSPVCCLPADPEPLRAAA